MTRTYTIHIPADGAPRTVRGADSMRFVKDGFTWTAFVVPALWMFVHRMWLPLLGYLVIAVSLDAVVAVFDAREEYALAVALLLNSLIGLEAGQMRRWSLRRRGWQMVGVVTGPDRMECERKAFELWLSGGLAAESEIDYETPADDADVIGLFPPPETSRW